jgi:hypothetical protein
VRANLADISLVLDKLIEREVEEDDCCDASDHEQRLEFLSSDI